MPKEKISLLDRAKGDLKVAKSTLILGLNDDVVLDIVAHHCSQCVEKIVKYLILTEGKDYAPDHRSDVYLEDLSNDRVRQLVESISEDLDRWATTIRYAGSIKSSKKAVERAICVCEELLKIASSGDVQEIGGVEKDRLTPVESLFKDKKRSV